MVRILIAALSIGCSAMATAETGGRHQWTLEVALGLSSSSTDFESFIDGRFGKLRSADSIGFGATRLFAEYRGRLAPTLDARVVADYLDDASPGIDLTEAYLEWRPIPRSPLRQRWRLGAFYPPLSLENGERGWRSPYTLSFSAINSWLGEEIRPVGLEWSVRRPLGPSGSPHDVGAFAAVFYGNDPAGTLLFWRGFAIHDRQSRLGDELSLAPDPVFDERGVIVDHREQSFSPFAEIDGDPGYYGGIEWRYARRALLKLALYDNRADPFALADGQWGWNTRFSVLAAQLELTDTLGLVTQWMSGDTRWLIATTPFGMTRATELVHDEFEAKFALLTRSVGDRHRVTLRYDDFDYARSSGEAFDAGHAWTIGYRYDTQGRVTLSFEGLLIDSERDLWTDFYAAPHGMIERQLRFEVSVRLSP